MTDAGTWFLAAVVGVATVYAVAWLAGHGFGRGFFQRKKRYNEEFLDKLDNRSVSDGTEE